MTSPSHTFFPIVQVADLEEERRKLRMELKFRAKYHGQYALEMGLTPDQVGKGGGGSRPSGKSRGLR